MNIEQRVKEIAAEQFDVELAMVETTSTITNLGGDSLNGVEFVMALEEEFGVEIPDEEAEKLLTVGDALRYIEDKAGK